MAGATCLRVNITVISQGSFGQTPLSKESYKAPQPKGMEVEFSQAQPSHMGSRRGLGMPAAIQSYLLEVERSSLKELDA